MPNYDYHCSWCKKDCERMVSIKMRDEQTCDSPSCHNFNQLLQRLITFNGMVWSPTSTGSMHK